VLCVFPVPQGDMAGFDPKNRYLAVYVCIYQLMINVKRSQHQGRMRCDVEMIHDDDIVLMCIGMFLC
jgi:hypothetical protein